MKTFFLKIKSFVANSIAKFLALSVKTKVLSIVLAVVLFGGITTGIVIAVNNGKRPDQPPTQSSVLDSSSEEAHTHIFNINNKNDTYHWKECECGEIEEKFLHTYTDRQCTCGAIKPTEGLKFTLSDDKTYYSVSGIGTATDTKIVIPSTYNNLPVKSIWHSVFWHCSSLTSVTIPDSVVSIGTGAFYGCSSLTEINISNNATTIEDYAFSACSSLTEMTIPNSVTFIGDHAFFDCSSLTSITIPNSVTSIGDSAFSACSSLTEIAIPDSVASIGGYTFFDCSSLTSITIPNSVTSIGMNAFNGCSSLRAVYITDVAAWCAIDFEYSSNPLTYAHNLYLNNQLVTKLKIPDSVTTIGEYTFRNCSSLTEIIIPDSVTTIETGALSGCDSLTKITLPFVDNIKDGTENGYFAYIFGDGNGAPGDYVPTSLKTVVITSGAIGGRAFVECSSLTEIVISDRVTYIGFGAFYGCSSLTKINIPDSVITIGESAFEECSSLTEINIPDSVTSIEECSFLGCSNLTNITVDKNNINYKSIDGNLYTKDGGVLVQYAIGKTATEFAIPDSVTSIGLGAFCECNSLTEITIPDSVTSIGELAFEGCSSLTNVTFENVEGWTTTCYDGTTYTISSTDLADTEKAATYLTDIYTWFYTWTRSDE